MLKKEAKKIVVSLGNPSKMPCKSYGLPAEACITGSKLRKVKGSTCADCYACKGCYKFSNTQEVLWERLESIYNPQWVDAMITLIKGTPYFRWHDSGDLQSELHLDKIVQICIETPETKHWLPTREYDIVKRYIEAGNVIPPNLCIRLSATMVGMVGPYALAKKLGVCVSEVGRDKYTCPASLQNNECKDCRTCWDTNTMNVRYKLH